MIVRGMRSAAGSTSSAGGSVAVIRAPPGRREDGRSGAPSTVTSPSSMRRGGWRGGTSGAARERKPWSRSPGLSAVSSSVFTFRFRRRVLGEEGVADQEDDDADGDGRVGHVEGRPEPDVDKIGDPTQTQAGDEVAGGAAKHHADDYGRDDVVERRV